MRSAMFRTDVGTPEQSRKVQKTTGVQQRRRPHSGLERLLMGRFGLAVTLPLVWLRRMRDRHELARLDEAQLKDVGLNPEMVRRESAKPFWLA